MSITISTLGFPRIGPRRELKTAVERYWAGKLDRQALLETAAGLRAAQWARQHGMGVTHIPSNDFSFYDQVLDTSVMVGAVPAEYGWTGGEVNLDTYFAMARGSDREGEDSLPALEMTKWFDTNYHYMVPRFTEDQHFVAASTKPVDEFREALALGIHTRPVLLGPVTYLLLGKMEDGRPGSLSLLPRLLPVYIDVLKQLAAAGADWVQIDEPCLALDLDAEAQAALSSAYAAFATGAPGIRVMLTTYFGELGENKATALSLPVAGLHIDLVRGRGQLDGLLRDAPADLVLSLGIIDGRNVWRADLAAALDLLERAVEQRGREYIVLAPSCSLLHVPIDLALEEDMDAELRSWLAFAIQKVDELRILGKALDDGRASVAAELDASTAAQAERATSALVHRPEVAERAAAVTPEMARRASPFAVRRALQQKSTPLPLFPTTTIGSFPQTLEVRRARAAHDRGTMTDADYEAFLHDETARAIAWQEEIGIDVLVHGEFERNDMVQYFGEQLAGYAFTRHGWVQSYGSRCVRPPIIYGDVERRGAMTVDWATYAQSLTKRPVKGMLTGPVTMLEWSFVRDDVGRAEVCQQIALALRDEVSDLAAAGIRIIQIDEPALREGLPLRRSEWAAYLAWAVEAFRLATSAVPDDIQIHTHMCYAEFNDIIEAIAGLDADVISIESARSKMDLLRAFTDHAYPNDIGPGVYDIHSPRVPGVEEMEDLISRAEGYLSPSQLWVNPDCGLKTRGWDEVRPALANMVETARRARKERATERA